MEYRQSKVDAGSDNHRIALRTTQFIRRQASVSSFSSRRNSDSPTFRKYGCESFACPVRLILIKNSVRWILIPSPKLRFMKETVYSPLHKHLVCMISQWGKQPHELRRTFAYVHKRIIGPVFGICPDTVRRYKRSYVEPNRDSILKHLEELFHIDVLLVVYFAEMRHVVTILLVLHNAIKASIERHKFAPGRQSVISFLRYLIEELKNEVDKLEALQSAQRNRTRQ